VPPKRASAANKLPSPKASAEYHRGYPAVKKEEERKSARSLPGISYIYEFTTDFLTSRLMTRVMNIVRFFLVANL